MFIQEFYLENWDWQVKVYYAVDTFYMDDILSELELLGCDFQSAMKIKRDLTLYPYNNGLTYSSFDERSSIVVIGLTNSPDEFQNTFDHEKGHLAMHISECDNIDVYSEDFQYLTGEIGRSMFPIAKRFMCEHCRKDLKIGE